MQSSNITFHEGKVTQGDRNRLLGQKGLVVWLTGLSASGKSTIAVEAEKVLLGMGKVVYRLDGDNVRFGLNSDLGFSERDRFENIRRIAEVCALFQDAGIIVLASFISPLCTMRQLAREKARGSFLEVYVKADLLTCMKRDPKGLYEKARKGEIKNFTGISAPYEEPQNPELVLNTERDSLEDCVSQLVEKILEKSTSHTVDNRGNEKNTTPCL
ncbi:MAG: adenylyl-sulfate kinase [Clostridiaceae bacterium]|nr:adenylyl-sulfate kinase [Clostridiaceae bacterium]